MTLSRRHFIQSTAIAAATAAPLGFPSIVRAADAKEFRLGLITPAGHSWNRAALQFGEALKKETDGRLSVTVFHSGQLGNETAMMQQLQSGALDMGWIQAAELGSRVSSVAAINAPYLVRSTPAVAKLVKTPAALKLLEVLPRETGTIGLGWGITGMRAVFATKDISAPTDLKGMKLRVVGSPLFSDIFTALGANPTQMSWADAQPALSSGAVDGQENPMSVFTAAKMHTIGQKHVTMWGYVADPLVFVVNKEVWASWTPADQAIVRQAAIDAGKEEIAIARKGLIEADKPLLKEIAALGVTITELTPAEREAFVKATRPVYDKWKSQIGADLVNTAEKSIAARKK